DHVSNTAVQIELMEAIGAPQAIFGHFSLMLSASGEGLSKRAGSQGVRDIRAAGLEPMSLTSLLARLGSADAVEAAPDMETLIKDFDMDRLGRAPARFDNEDLHRLNALILRDMPYEKIETRLAEMGASGDSLPEFWNCIRGNITLFADVGAMMDLVYGAIVPQIEEADYIAQALATLPLAPLTQSSWRDWTQALKEQTGRKGRDLFMPLRLALTGQAHGPEMKDLLPLIGYQKSVLRLEGKKG
ncbi:MAG: glutamate--tRNA ligase, partial [Alphaproteobacteria bacterium]|nr:glutamate--tRNA ligase [Alphaproteobacteria bacterium]